MGVGAGLYMYDVVVKRLWRDNISESIQNTYVVTMED